MSKPTGTQRIVSFEGIKGTGMTLSSIALIFKEPPRGGRIITSNYDTGRHFEFYDKEKFLKEIEEQNVCEL